MVAVLAILGLLVHAFAYVRHAGMMVDQSGAREQLAADLRILCSGEHFGDPVSNTAELPPLPQKPGDCPICTGLVSAAAVLPPDAPSLGFRVDARSERHRAIAIQLADLASDRLPPPRGPPELS